MSDATLPGNATLPEHLKLALLDPWFQVCLREAIGNKTLIAQCDRLCGTNLGMKGSPIALMIDQATGRHEGEIAWFIGFVFDFVYTRLERPKEFEKAGEVLRAAIDAHAKATGR